MRKTACVWCRRLREDEWWTDRYAEKGTLIATRSCPNCEVAQRLADLSHSFAAMREATQTAGAAFEGLASALRVQQPHLPWLERAKAWFVALPAGVVIAAGVVSGIVIFFVAAHLL